MSTEDLKECEEEVVAAIGAFLLLENHEGMGPHGKIVYAAPVPTGVQVSVLEENE